MDVNTGEILFEAQIFVAVLGASNYTFAYATRTQTLADWIDAHMRAFVFIDGVPEIVNGIVARSTGGRHIRGTFG